MRTKRPLGGARCTSQRQMAAARVPTPTPTPTSAHRRERRQHATLPCCRRAPRCHCSDFPSGRSSRSCAPVLKEAMAYSHLTIARRSSSWLRCSTGFGPNTAASTRVLPISKSAEPSAEDSTPSSARSWRSSLGRLHSVRRAGRWAAAGGGRSPGTGGRCGSTGGAADRLPAYVFAPMQGCERALASPRREPAVQAQPLGADILCRRHSAARCCTRLMRGAAAAGKVAG